MKKFLASTVFIALFATYTLYLHANSQVVSANTTTDTQTLSTQTVTTDNATATTNTTQTPSQISTTVAATNPTPTPAPTPAQTTVTTTTPADQPKGQYRDGTYTGSSENAFYGNVQVKVTVSGGKITNIAFLDYPNDRRQSEEINSQALPILKQEAISAQSAQVDGVSGATDTSEAFVRSLATALSSAKA